VGAGVPLAKVTRPRLAGVVARKRLFLALDRARRNPVVWVSGPPGAGKSVLVASYLADRGATTLWYRVDGGDEDVATFFFYLNEAARRLRGRRCRPLPPCTPEYFIGLETFARRYFEALYACLRPPFVLVLDDYQEVGETSTFQEAMVAAVQALPEGANLMVVSRRPPPATLARPLAYGSVAEMGWEELRLTEAETGRLMRERRNGHVSRAEVAAVHCRSGGWAAGVVLLATTADVGRTATPGPGGEKDLPEVLFDYFAGELFDRHRPDMQSFLMQVALLPRTTVGEARALTGCDEAGRFLGELARNHELIERHPDREAVFRLHPLYRAFLMHRAEAELTPAEWRRLRLRAAEVVEAAGEVEAAVGLYRAAEAWTPLAQLVCREAPRLLPQGRGGSVARWITLLPQEEVERVPWAAYWLAVCRLPFAPAEAEALFEAAFTRFDAEADRTGQLLACAGAVEAVGHTGCSFQRLDPWIDRLDTLTACGSELPSLEVELRVTAAMVAVLAFRRPDHRDADAWVERAHRLLGERLDLTGRVMLGFFLGTLHLWRGDLDGVERVREVLAGPVRSPAAQPLARIVWGLLEGRFLAVRGRWQESEAAFDEALMVGRESGVRLWDFQLLAGLTNLALSQGDVATAADRLARMAGALEGGGRRIDRVRYHGLMAAMALQEGRPQEALHRARTAVADAVELGAITPEAVSREVLVEALILADEGSEAKREVERLHRLAEASGSATIQYLAALAGAQEGFATDRHVAALRHLRTALALARERGFVSHYGYTPKKMAALYVHALEAEVEVDYVQSLIRATRLVLPEPPVHLDTWPWAVRVHTLGRFELEVNGAPVSFTGKGQLRPLELLCGLIVFGDEEVEEERLAAALWPGSDGDAAHRAFATNLHRLRKLIGHDDALALRQGRLSLNPRLCWVDAVAFERLVAGVERLACGEGVAAAEVTRIAQGIDLYRGPFLGAVEGVWVIGPRERLRTRYLESVFALGCYHEAAGAWEEAGQVYRKGLAVDDLEEELYQGLMRCDLRLGRCADGVRIYERCRARLQTLLDVEPSPETEALYRRLRQ